MKPEKFLFSVPWVHVTALKWPLKRLELQTELNWPLGKLNVDKIKQFDLAGPKKSYEIQKYFTSRPQTQAKESS